MSDAPKSHGRLSITPSLRPRELMAEPQVQGAWTASIVTLFPEAFPGILGLSLTGKALAQGLWNLRTIPLRDFGIGRHRNVDDTPAGGGAGMVIRADVMDAALREAREMFEREYLVAQINRFGGNISRTAQFVGMERSALHRKLKSLGVVGGMRPEDELLMGK